MLTTFDTHIRGKATCKNSIVDITRWEQNLIFHWKVILYTIMLDQSVTTIWLKMISQKQKHDLVPIDKKTAW